MEMMGQSIYQINAEKENTNVSRQVKAIEVAATDTAVRINTANFIL